MALILNDVILTTKPDLQHARIEETLGFVSAENIFEMNLFISSVVKEADPIKVLKNVNDNKLREARLKSQDELKIEALKKNADAVVDFSIDYREMLLNGKNMWFMRVSGTAVKMTKRFAITTEPDSAEE